MRLAFTAIPLWLAILPLAAYLAVIGSFHLRRRPVVVPGSFDGAMLAAGVSGLVMAGPLALVQPLAGTSAWTALAFLAACVILVAAAILATRPRIVVYNVGLERLRPVVAELAAGLDPASRWAGETVALPSRGLQIQLDDRGPARSVTVLAAGSRPATESWSEFSRLLRRGISAIQMRRSRWGGCVFLGLAAAIVAASWLLARASAAEVTSAMSAPRSACGPTLPPCQDTIPPPIASSC